ncbi:hypothetical protein ACH4ZX_27820 [Streptomyces sp. NPDC020490]|uniref:hypothetical protein n=1 Tax=Streptomyces sp. NPDC020490 TaxID=3365078 RepID=UPI00378F0A8D
MTASPPEEGEVRFTGPAPEVYLNGRWQVMGDEAVTGPLDDAPGFFFKGDGDGPDD